QTLVTEPTPDMPLVGGYALAIGDGGQIAFEDGGALFYYDRVTNPQLIDAEMDFYNISLSGTSLLTYEVNGQLKQWNGSEIKILHSLLDAPKGNYHSVNASGQVAWNSSISHASAG